MVLVAVDKNSHSLDFLKVNRCFAVNILRLDQVDISRRFAMHGPKDFMGLSILSIVTGAPILAHRLAYVDCRVIEILPGGDHEIFVGEIVSGELQGGQPLLYGHRQVPMACRLNMIFPWCFDSASRNALQPGNAAISRSRNDSTRGREYPLVERTFRAHWWMLTGRGARLAVRRHGSAALYPGGGRPSAICCPAWQPAGCPLSPAGPRACSSPAGRPAGFLFGLLGDR